MPQLLGSRALNGVAGLLVTILALAIGHEFVSDWRTAEQALEWRTVPGEVTSSGTRRSSSRKQRVPRVTYRYVVDGDTLTGRRIAFQNISFRRFGEAREIARLFRKGTRVTVFVHPRDKRTAILLPGGDTAVLAAAVVLAACLGLLGLAMIYLAFRPTGAG